MKTSPKFISAQLLDLSSSFSEDTFTASFQNLSQDPYVAEGFRYKEIARYRVLGSQVVRQSHGALFQSREHNPTHGDIIREYPAFDAKGLCEEAISEIVQTFVTHCGLGYEDEVLFQAQRIRTDAHQTGHPAIEGWHQDGTNYIGMMCVARQNIAGGRSQLSFDQGKNKVMDHELQPGELLILDDRRYWHYATPVKPVDPSKEAYRDIFIITAPSCREPERLKLALSA